MTDRTIDAINILSKFCGKRDLDVLSQDELEKKFGIRQVDVAVLFGGSILCGADEFAKVINSNMAKTYMIVGGEGHTTSTLRNRILQMFPEVVVENRTEAELFDEYIRNKYGLKADYLECESTNCGNNITNLLNLLKNEGIEFQSILLMQDATMQNRMDAVIRKYVDADKQIINFATYTAQVQNRDNRLAYTKEILGMWKLEHFISLLLGEIPRLTDDENGYGPKGKGYIAHVEIPELVRNAFNELANEYPELIREANPNYASK